MLLTTALSGTRRPMEAMRRPELISRLGPVDGGIVGPDQLDAVLLQSAVLGEGDGQVERGLTAQGGQQRVRAARPR